MRFVRIGAIGLALLAAVGLGAQPVGAGQVRAAEGLVILGTDTVRVEVASTPSQREQGLKQRSEVPDGTGMLFVFQSEAARSFWMQDTYQALDIAFIDAQFRIVDIQQMEAGSTALHTSKAPAMFALEVRRGWLGERGVRVGDVVQFVPSGG